MEQEQKQKNDKLNIFTDPEKIDAIINSKLKQFPCKGGTTCSRKVTWSDAEIELMDGVIMQYITEQGLSRERTAQQIHSRWDISMSTARRYIKEAIERMASTFEEDNDKLRKIWLERCEAILADSIENYQKDSALKALDMLAKSMGFYKEQKDINISGESTIKFDFS